MELNAIAFVKVLAAVVSSSICISTICCGRRHVDETKLKGTLIKVYSCLQFIHGILCFICLFGFYSVCIGIIFTFTGILGFFTSKYPKIQCVVMFMVLNITCIVSSVISCVFLFLFLVVFGTGPGPFTWFGPPTPLPWLPNIWFFSMCLQLIIAILCVAFGCSSLTTNATDTDPHLDIIQNVLPAQEVNAEGSKKSRSEHEVDAGVGPTFSHEAYKNIY